MQWSFFRISVVGGEAADDFNRFLRSVRVLTVNREFVSQGEGSFWALAVEYLPQEGSLSRPARAAGSSAAKVDYKAELPAEDFAYFARLREWRKLMANQEAVPVYTIFTNEQLAEIAKRRCSSLSALGEIDGIGQGRLDKYGAAVLDIMVSSEDENINGSHPTDS